MKEKTILIIALAAAIIGVILLSLTAPFAETKSFEQSLKGTVKSIRQSDKVTTMQVELVIPVTVFESINISRGDKIAFTADNTEFIARKVWNLQQEETDP